MAVSQRKPRMSVITDKKAFEKAAIPIVVTDSRRAAKLIESLSPAERRWVRRDGIRRALPTRSCNCPTPRATSRP